MLFITFYYSFPYNINFRFQYKTVFFINTKKNSSIKKYIKKHIKNREINQRKNINDNLTKINLQKKDNINYIDKEINGFSYDFALKYDKRTYCQFNASLIKTQHNLIYALFNNKDYNSRIIKIDLFFIGFTIEYTINAFFYNNDIMHKIYAIKGDFDLETQIPIIVYSTIISMILNYPLNFLSLSNDAVIYFKLAFELLCIN